MNWDDPVERYRLIEQVGHQEYNRLMLEHIENDVEARQDQRSGIMAQQAWRRVNPRLQAPPPLTLPLDFQPSSATSRVSALRVSA